MLSEFHRVLRLGGYLLLAFQTGEDVLHLDDAFGHRVSLDFHRLQPANIEALLNDTGFDVLAQLVRAPDPTSTAAKIPQGFLIAGSPTNDRISGREEQLASLRRPCGPPTRYVSVPRTRGR